MKLIAKTRLMHRADGVDTGSTIVDPGQEFEIDDKAGKLLLAQGEATEPGSVDARTAGRPGDEEIAKLLDKKKMDDVVDAIDEITDVDTLQAIGGYEAAHKNRTAVLAAVSARLGELTKTS